MEDQPAVEAIEIERKYEVAVDAPLPPNAAFQAVGFEADPPAAFQLVASYFDTPREALARIGVAVRVREGGKDAGWHLKQREASGVRELQWPPSQEMPAALAAEIRARIGDAVAEVVPRAELRTDRVILVLRDSGGRAAVEIADDRVLATDHARGVRRAWREWEAEVLPDGAEFQLDVIEPVLVQAGAQLSASPAKIARATGKLLDLARQRGASEGQIAALSALDVADQEAARRLEA